MSIAYQAIASALRSIGSLLVLLGRHGTTALILSIPVGLIVPGLAQAMRPHMLETVVVMTVGSFLASRFTVESSWLERYVLYAITWSAIGAPLLFVVAIVVMKSSGMVLGPELEVGALVSLIGPPAGSAVTAAALLSLSPRLALISMIAATVVAPLSIPLVSAMSGAHMSIDAVQMALRTFLIVGGAWVVATLIWRWQPRWLIPTPAAASGISVLGLCGTSFAVMDAVKEHWNATPHLLMSFILVWIALRAALTLAGLLAFLPLGFKDALTVGLLTGNRNVSMTWAAAGSALTGAGEAFASAALLTLFAMPFVLQQSLRLAEMIGFRSGLTSATILFFPIDRPEAFAGRHVRRGVPLRVGRSIDAEVRILDPAVSRDHARVFISGGRMRFEDMGSRNGVYLDGERLTAGVVAPGQVLQIGRTGIMLKPPSDATRLSRLVR